MTNQEIKLIEVCCPVCNSDQKFVVAEGYDFEYSTSNDLYKLYECLSCSLIYLTPRPDAEELSKIYPENYNPFHFHVIRNPIVRWGRNFVQKKKVESIRRFLPDNAHIIDVGCGSGALLQLLKKHGSSSWKLWGNDMSEVNKSYLKNNGINFIGGRFEEFESSKKYDLIILNQTIEHLEFPVKVLEKAYSLLTNNGSLFIETPSIDGRDYKIFKRKYWGGYHIPRHWSLFSKKNIVHTLEKSGFRNCNVSFLNSPSFWIQSFHHYFLDNNYPKWWTKLWVFKNPVLLFIFTAIDTLSILTKKPTSNMRIICRK